MVSSKIKSVQANGTYDSQYGEMFKYEVELEDGSVGEVSSKMEGRWKEGDEVEYTSTNTNWGVKLKLNKPGTSDGPRNFGGGQKSPPSPDVQKRIDGSWSMGQAIAILGSCPKEVSVEQWLDDVSDVAQLILSKRNAEFKIDE